MLWYLRCCIFKLSKSLEREYEKRVEENQIRLIEYNEYFNINFYKNNYNR